ncbi:MAG: helix-turn-helix domain-containing protein [Marinifilum sp.]|jgi:transcriptional regulator with XRE-family HTH domain|nr:helix-turn-helix domain-containing protein [Marinifilum sp.]
MGRKTVTLLPKYRRLLSSMGENIKLARLRRNLSTEQIAERANLSRPTLAEIEKGNPNTSMGAYLQVLAALGLEQDLSNVAKDDLLGRKLQDISIKKK